MSSNIHLILHINNSSIERAAKECKNFINFKVTFHPIKIIIIIIIIFGH